jgi:hypothetical protein
MADAIKGRWWRRFGNLGGRTVLVLVVLAVLVAAADRSKALLDLSADRRFTLSPRLEALVRQQQEPVELVAIWSGGEESRFAAVRSVLERIDALTPRVAFRHIDPELQKPLMAEFAERHREAIPGSLYVVRGERVFRLALNDASRLFLQRDVGGALLTLASAKPTPALLLQGHGELRSRGGLADGNDQLAHLLTLSGFAVGTVGPERAADPPAEALLVVAGPTAPLGERDLRLLDQHLTDGGGLLLLTDDRCPTDLGAWLRRRGVLSEAARPKDLRGLFAPDAACEAPTIAVSFRNYIAGQELEFPNHNLAITAANPQHPASRNLAGSDLRLLFPWTAPLLPIHPATVGQGGSDLAAAFVSMGTPLFEPQPLLFTAPGDVWTKSRAAPLATPNPRLVALALEYQPADSSVRAGMGGRLIVWGSRQAASDAVLSQVQYANARFLVSCSEWLARRTAGSDIPEAEVAAFQVRATDQGLLVVLALLVAVMPCLCIGAAMLTWWDRR